MEHTICGIKSWTQLWQLITLDRILLHINYSYPWKATTFSFQNMKAVSLYLNPLWCDMDSSWVLWEMSHAVLLYFMKLNSVTRWFDYFAKFGHLQQWKLVQFCNKFAKVGSTWCQLRNKPPKNGRRLVKFRHIWSHCKWKTIVRYPFRQMFSLCRTQTWCSFLPQSTHITNGSRSSKSFFFSLKSSFLTWLEEEVKRIRTIGPNMDQIKKTFVPKLDAECS